MSKQMEARILQLEIIVASLVDELSDMKLKAVAEEEAREAERQEFVYQSRAQNIHQARTQQLKIVQHQNQQMLDNQQNGVLGALGAGCGLPK